MVNLLQLIENELPDFYEKCLSISRTEGQCNIILLFIREMKSSNLYLESEIESAAKYMHDFLKQSKHEALFYFAMVAQSER